jgi:magnesium chelatase family protein
MGPKEIQRFCEMEDSGKEMLQRAIKKWGFSLRAGHRILKVARTIADLDDSANLSVQHLAEAIGYRQVSVLALP